MDYTEMRAQIFFVWNYRSPASERQINRIIIDNLSILIVLLITDSEGEWV